MNGEGRIPRIDATSLRGAECSQVMKKVEESIGKAKISKEGLSLNWSDTVDHLCDTYPPGALVGPGRSLFCVLEVLQFASLWWPYARKVVRESVFGAKAGSCTR